MSSDDYIPTQKAAVSVRCEPCNRSTVFDSQEMVWYLQRRRLRPVITSVVAVFRCQRCDAPPSTVRIVQPVKETTPLPGTMPVERLG